MPENQIKNDSLTKRDDPRPDIFWLLSGVYCMLIVILSIVICSSHYTTNDVSEFTVDVYFVILTLAGSIWLTTFRTVATSCGQHPGSYEDVKSSHSTNRWLKGILVIFGVAIIIKDVLELLTTAEYTDPACKNAMFFLAPIAEMIFIITEVNFLFRYSKIHLQGQTTYNRFGTMHVIATNLSIWILIIIDESMADHGGGITDHTNTDSTPVMFTTPALPTGCNITDLMNVLNQSDVVQSGNLGRRAPPSSSISEQIFGPSGCTCNTSYCQAVSEAHSYLYPFLVEFSLVASCMVYIVWKNIGEYPQHTSPPVKPSYKFYKSYKGLALGVVVLIMTIVVLIFSNYGIKENNSGGLYDSHKTTMTIYNGYMVGAEVLMLIACFIGVGLFRADPRPLHVSLNLDNVLLLVTLVGVATLDMYYLFAVYISLISPHYEYKWIWGVVYPVLDLLQVVIQVGFILGGSARVPEQERDLEEVVEFTPSYSENGESNDSGIVDGFKNEAFDSPDYDAVIEDDVNTKEDCANTNEESSPTSTKESAISYDTDLKIVELPIKKTRETLRSVSAIKQIPKTCRKLEEDALQERIRQHDGRPKIAPPTLIRLYIRDTLMFLLICNACLWMFWSLEGPNIKTFAYPNQYFSAQSQMRNLWNRATMFCLPLAIFFRMHSCACLFEMWSFT